MVRERRDSAFRRMARFALASDSICRSDNGRRLPYPKSGIHPSSSLSLEPFACGTFRSAATARTSHIAAVVRAHGTPNMETFANRQLMRASWHTFGLKSNVAFQQAGREKKYEADCQ